MSNKKENSLSSIILIIPYFGKFPNYINFFLESCRNNNTINWLILSDNPKPSDLPENILYVQTTFDKIQKHIQKYFDFEIKLTSPYKLCDFKPFYGLIFENYIRNYDFWGYCDLDMIFGDIRHFLTENVLLNHDKIFSRGHLSIFRNNDYMKHFGINQTENTYRLILSSPYNFSFDEWGKVGISHFIKNKISHDKFYNAIDFFDIIWTKKQFKKAQNAVGNLPNFFKYCRGKLYNISLHKNKKPTIEEYIYVHFQKRNLKIKTRNFQNYIIIPNEIIENTDLSNVHVTRNPLYFNALKIRFRNLKRKFKIKERKEKKIIYQQICPIINKLNFAYSQTLTDASLLNSYKASRNDGDREDEDNIHA